MADNDLSGNQQESNSSENQGGDYNKLNVQDTSGTTHGSGMQRDRTPGTVGGGTLPDKAEGSGTPLGGRNTSNSTVEAGGTTGGGTPGIGATTDRGRIPTRDYTTQSGGMLDRQAGGDIGGQSAPETQEPTSDAGRKGSSPLSPEEADRINQDARKTAGPPVPNDIGHERY